MRMITEAMIWYFFVRACIEDFRNYINRKFRKKMRLE